MSEWPTYPDLHGKVAVVTGGSRGIGAATSRLLAAQGVKVVIVGREEAAIEETVGRIEGEGGNALGISADVTDSSALVQAREKAEAAFGPAELILPFAGGGLARPGPIQELGEDAWHASVEGNLTATFLTVKCFLPALMAQERGVIVTMASSAARLPTPQAPLPYAAAKAGIIALTRQLAGELAQHGIRANCVVPSTILTERTAQQIPAERLEAMVAAHPLGRLGTPEDVALAALFLVSSSAAWITGVTLDVAGGSVML